MKIIVVRHGTTKYNEQEIINGTIDESLSPAGIEQVIKLVEDLADYDFDVVYSSTLKRAIETATPIAKRYNLVVKPDVRIVEVSLGRFNGQPYESTIPAFGLKSSDLISTYDYDLSAYGGETGQQTKDRVESFIKSLREDTKAKPLIVTHGGILRWFNYLCTGQKIGLVPNSSIHVYDI